THGMLNSQCPSASFLVLAPDGGREGRLAVGDIAGLPLGGVRLVTLSACQTALGDRDPGSEVTTMADAFSFAGSPSLMATLWKVADESTCALMLDFYSNLKQGQSLSRSLQGAQVKLLSRPDTAHPFYWAPFVLMGDWR
ncbi:MAG: CHAT domain-containing protein, partial [Candidatus Eremiobacterota bacterium]